MISPEEIKSRSEKWYREILISYLEGTDIFPKYIRFGKIKASEIQRSYAQINKSLNRLKELSKNSTGYGYFVEYTERNTLKFGRNLFPEDIRFDTEDDYLKFHEKESEFIGFKTDANKILSSIGNLRSWMLANPLKVVMNNGKWDALLEVCSYFIENPRPGIYLREIPVRQPTKFIEENQPIIRELLDFLIPDYINAGESSFEKRYNLKYNEPLIRIKILDDVISSRYFSGLKDISLPVGEFNSLRLECSRILMFENKANFSNVYNFLSLPHMSGTLSLFGRGFGVGLLKDNIWLKEKEIFYWGDIDAHGFMILSQLRSYFPRVKSIFMDIKTFDTFSEFAVRGADAEKLQLQNLSGEESDLYFHLFHLERNRLEQEKIPHWYVIERLGSILRDNG
ncbi:MAG TPA: Wadjet anti-phage system protein JetD domain-containing protein [Ignavibacteriales bacterium]|nr:Wadjet anti-phage system protein JetD domain-containing protein [Ignavibacteriales bacterium]